MTRKYPASPVEIAAHVKDLGFAICPSAIDPSLLAAFEGALADVEGSTNVRSRGSVYAIRNLLTAAPAVRKLAEAEPLIALARSVLGDTARPVRGLLFDKRPEVNWLVPWHQDLTICVKERREIEGFGPWSVKAGVVHVQPPARVLEEMVALRIHLDDAPADNGALRVLPGTHLLGRLSPAKITTREGNSSGDVCKSARQCTDPKAAAAARFLGVRKARSPESHSHRVLFRRTPRRPSLA